MRSTYFFLPLVLCASLAVAQAQDKGKDVNAAPSLEKTIYSSPEEDLLPIDAQIISRFNHRGFDRAVLKSVDFVKKENDGSLAKDANRDFKSFTFYVNPLVLVEKDELEKSFNDKRPIGDFEAKLYEMSFHVLLIDDDVKNAAAAAVNAQFPNARITAQNIAVIPYKFIEFTAVDRYGTRVPIGAYPDRTVSRAYNTADRPDGITVTIRGSEDDLKHVTTQQAHVGANFLVSGFSVKQNIVSASLYNLVRLGYYRFLTGQADWSLLRSAQLNRDDTGLSLGPISLGDSTLNGQETIRNESWVTRNQLRAVLAQSLFRVDLSQWTELKTDADARQIVLDLLEKQVLKRGDIIDARIDKAGDTWKVEDQRVLNDLDPTILAKISSAIKDHTDRKNQTSVTAKGVTASEDDSYVADSDISWGTDGTLSVPKSISLVNVHASAFSDFASMSYTETVATKGAINELFQGVVRHWQENVTSTRQVPVTRRAHLEVWYNHFDPGSLYLVVNPDIRNTNLGGPGGPNNVYKRWCTAFNPSQYRNLSQPINAASDEHIHVAPEAYGLPAINPRWPQIMDDEHWYIYDYDQDGTEDRQITETQDRYES